MHTHATKNLLLFSIILITLLTFGCNTENEGVFMRISESVVKVDVGSVDLIMKDDNNLYSYTGKSGLQSYDILNKTWNRVESSAVMHYTNDGSDIVYAEQAVGETANTLVTYDISETTASDWTTGQYVVAMNPTANLALVKDEADDFGVYSVNGSDKTITQIIDLLQFTDDIPPQLIASSSTIFVVSGKSKADTTKYVHSYGTVEALALSDTTFYEKPVVAVGGVGTNVILIDSAGKVWEGTTAANDFIATTSIPSFPARVPADAPYPTFVHGANLYIQNSNNDFYSVNLTTGEVSADKLGAPFTEFSYIPINSYLVDLLDPDIIYVGTKENGIWRIDMGSSEVAQL